MDAKTIIAIVLVVFIGDNTVGDAGIRQACMAMIILKYPYIVSSLS